MSKIERFVFDAVLEKAGSILCEPGYLTEFGRGQVHILMQIMAEGLKSVRITEDRESAEQLPEGPILDTEEICLSHKAGYGCVYRSGACLEKPCAKKNRKPE